MYQQVSQGALPVLYSFWGDFWTEHKDALILALLTALIGLIVGVLLKELLLSFCRAATRTAWRILSLLAQFTLIWPLCRKRYENALLSEINCVRIPGMGEPRELVSIYVQPTLESWRGARVDTPAALEEESLQDWRQSNRDRGRLVIPVNIKGELVMRHKLLIVGEPGAGKTVFLRYIAITSIKERHDQPVVPIYCRLLDFARSGKSLATYLEDIFEKYKFPNAGSFIRRQLTKGRCLLLLDGLDEIPDELRQVKIDEISRFSILYPEVSVIVASRPTGQEDALQAFRKLSICPLPLIAIRQFVHKWYSDDLQKSNALLEQLEHQQRILPLARNPLLLTLICVLSMDILILPRRRVRLIANCIDMLLTQWDRSKGVGRRSPLLADDVELILERISVYFLKQRTCFFSERDLKEVVEPILEDANLSPGLWRNFLKVASHYSGILMLVDESRRIYAFSHRVFAEYFAAKAIAADNEDIVLSNLQDEWYSEVIPLIAGVKRNATSYLEKLRTHRPETIFKTNLILCGKALAEASTVRSDVRYEIEQQLLKEYKETKFRLVRTRIGHVLAQIGNETVCACISSILEDRRIHWALAESATAIAGSLGMTELIPILTSRFIDNSIDGDAVSQALAAIASPSAIDILLDLLYRDYDKRDRNIHHHRVAAARGLVRIGSARCLEAVHRVILDQNMDCFVRERAIEALAISEDAATENLLVQLANRGAPIDVRVTSAVELARRGNSSYLNFLYDVIEKGGDDCYYIKRDIARALVDLGDHTSIQPLIRLLMHPTPNFFWGAKSFAAKALARIGGKESVGLLNQVIEKGVAAEKPHEEEIIRDYAIAAAVPLVGENSLDMVMSLALRDEPNFFALIEAIQAMPYIVGTESTLRTLIRDNYSNPSRIWIAESALDKLALISNDKQLPGFIAEVLRFAIERLCEVGNTDHEEAVEYEELANSAFEALNRIWSRRWHEMSELEKRVFYVSDVLQGQA